MKITNEFIKDLETKVQEYLNTVDDHEQLESYCTNREMSSERLGGFLSWLKTLTNEYKTLQSDIEKINGQIEVLNAVKKEKERLIDLL